jgi:signal transduction histidine kinase
VQSVKSKLILALCLVELLTLAMAVVLYFGALTFQDNARVTRQANDHLRDLLDFSLTAHGYMNAFERSLGQRTLIANSERRQAAQAFEERIRLIPAQHPQSSGLHHLAWDELQSISSALREGLRVADTLRAAGQFAEAERRFEQSKQSEFDRRMLPWFARAIAAASEAARAHEADALQSAARLRAAGVALAGFSALLATIAVLWISGAVIRPVRALVAFAEAIGRGDFEHRMSSAGTTEFALVLASFNHMAETIAATQASLLEKNKKLAEAYRMQGEFISVVTHELRSPLHSIRGYLEFIQEDEPGLSVPSQKNLRSIDEGAKRLLHLVNDILDFSKLEAKQLEIVRSRFDLRALLEEALSDARALIGDRPVQLVWEPPSQPLFLETDPARVRQILTNLLSNAVKFTAAGRVTLASDVSEEQIKIMVRDTGIGIHESQLGLIFQPFRQASGASRASGGTGLGLAIVARLAQLIGARVSVRSELDQGSEFALSLPRLPAHAA